MRLKQLIVIVAAGGAFSAKAAFAGVQAQAPSFDWNQAVFVLLLTATVLGGFMALEAVRRSHVRPRGRGHEGEAPPRRARQGEGEEGAGGVPDRAGEPRPESNVEAQAAYAPVGVRWARAVWAGLVATAVMTLLLMLASRAGLPELDTVGLLASAMGAKVRVWGWVAHFAVGGVLALIYAVGFAPALPGPPWARGAVYGILPFLAAQLIVLPAMGQGFFASNAPDAALLVTESFVGHLVYGAVLGALYDYGVAEEAPSAA